MEPNLEKPQGLLHKTGGATLGSLPKKMGIKPKQVSLVSRKCCNTLTVMTMQMVYDEQGIRHMRFLWLHDFYAAKKPAHQTPTADYMEIL